MEETTWSRALMLTHDAAPPEEPMVGDSPPHPPAPRVCYAGMNNKTNKPIAEQSRLSLLKILSVTVANQHFRGRRSHSQPKNSQNLG